MSFNVLLHVQVILSFTTLSKFQQNVSKNVQPPIMDFNQQKSAN